MRKKPRGSITLFFSVILFLLLSLVLVSVESARQQAAVGMLQSNVSMAMASLSGNYYAPLFDEFDIYGLYGTDIQKELQRYLSGTADPMKDLPEDYSGVEHSGYSFAYSEPKIQIKKQYMLTDADGEFMRRQMVTAGAYGGAETLIEELLEAIGVLKEQETGMKLLEEKADVEEQLTAMEMLLLELATSLDGVPTNLSGILCDEDGKIHPKSSFAKRILPFEPTREKVEIDSFALYFYLKPKYVVFPELLDALEALCFDEESATEVMVYYQIQEIKKILNSTLLETENSIEIIEKLMNLQTELKPKVRKYEDMLKASENLLSPEWKNMLGESLETMYQYIGDSDVFYDLPGMRDRLQSNKRILIAVRDAFALFTFDSAEQRYEDVCKAREAFQSYSVAGLSLQYAGMHRGTTVKNALWKALKNFLTEGLTSGIIDSNTVSMAKISTWGLPSSTIGRDEADLFLIDIPDDVLDSDGTAAWKIIKNLRLSKMVEMLRKGAEDLLEKTMLVSYVGTHFSNYTEDVRKSPLQYEMEYILFGNGNDSINLRQAALRLLGIRFAMNLIHTLVNPQKREKALIAATEFFGAAIPFLTVGCQYVILIAWALQNAKLEAVEIMSGKAVPFLVTQKSFQVGFDEIVTMSKTARFERAGNYQSAKGIAPEYKTYLLLLMMFRQDETLVKRSMDLIQEALKVDNPKFSLQKCYAGLSVTVQSSMQNRYSNLSFYRFGSGGGVTIEADGTILY